VSSEVAALPARPSSQTGHRGADGSGPPLPGERRAADLGTLADRPRSARALVTIETSAMRVLGRGGGGRRPGGGRPGRMCLAQRGELERRIHGAPHQLAERALGLSTDDRRGEHVFGKLRVGSDGRGGLQGFLQRPAAIPHPDRDDRKMVRRVAGRVPARVAPSAADTPTGSGSATASATPRASSSTPTTSRTSTSR
jgi:hypothetical protein